MIKDKNQRFYQQRDYRHAAKFGNGICHDGKFFRLEIERIRSRAFLAEEYRDLAPEVHALPHYHLALVTDNSGSWMDEGGLHKVRENELLLIPPYYPHMILACRPETYRMIILTFRYRNGDEFIDWSFDRLLASYTGVKKLDLPTSIQLSSAKASQMEELMEKLLDELLSISPRREIGVQQNFLELISFVYKLGKNSGKSGGAVENIIEINKIRDSFDRNPEDNTPLDVLAGKLNVSKEHFIRLFKREYGVPPGHYRQERRLEKALSLLLNSQLTIGETAIAAGFENIYYFSRMFKQYYMLSPQKYRQQAMDGKD